MGTIEQPVPPREERTALTMPADLRNALDKAAAEAGVSRAAWIKRACWEKLYREGLLVERRRSER